MGKFEIGSGPVDPSMNPASPEYYQKYPDYRDETIVHALVQQSNISPEQVPAAAAAFKELISRLGELASSESPATRAAVQAWGQELSALAGDPGVGALPTSLSAGSTELPGFDPNRFGSGN